MPAQSDSQTTIQELKDQVAKYRDERGWAKHHSPKNLAVSIAIEAAEKYPAEIFKPGQDSPEEYHRIKQEYRKNR